MLVLHCDHCGSPIEIDESRMAEQRYNVIMEPGRYKGAEGHYLLCPDCYYEIKTFMTDGFMLEVERAVDKINSKLEELNKPVDPPSIGGYRADS